MTVGRNTPCPCGSGRKAKKCHESVVGMRHDSASWYLDHLTFLEGCAGYMPPMEEVDRQEWRKTGCPFGDCNWETDAGVACAAACGV